VIPLLIVRPEPAASRSALRATALGLSPILCPLFEIRPCPWTAPDPAQFDAVAMTSANAARFGGTQLACYRHLPLYAVGAATASAARSAGFESIVTGDADAAALFDRIVRDERARVLHLCGEDRIAAGNATAITVYSAIEFGDHVPAGRMVVLLHSPRAARRYAALCPDRAQVDLIAISDAAVYNAGSGWHSINTADEPNDAAMLALAATLCEGTV
jgi:uroporphyrinogen-III synthase